MKKWLQGRSYEFRISPGMLFKRAYCCKCGEKLKKQFITVGYDPNDTDRAVGTKYYLYAPHDGTEYKDCFYVCYGCGYAISYDDQKIIAEYQKEGGRKILTHKQIEFLNHVFENKFNLE